MVLSRFQNKLQYLLDLHLRFFLTDLLIWLFHIEVSVPTTLFPDIVLALPHRMIPHHMISIETDKII